MRPAGLIRVGIEHHHLEPHPLGRLGEHPVRAVPRRAGRGWRPGGSLGLRQGEARAPGRSGRRRNSSSRLASAGSLSREDGDGEEPAFLAPASPIAKVATGMPPGIWTIDRSESRPFRCLEGTGTPSTGSGVFAASMPGRCAAPPAPAMMHCRPRPRGLLGVLIEEIRRAMGGDHPRLVRDAECRQLPGGVLHHLPVRVTAHHDADQRGAHPGLTEWIQGNSESGRNKSPSEPGASARPQASRVRLKLTVHRAVDAHRERTR